MNIMRRLNNIEIQEKYYSREELLKMNFLHLGKNVKISRRTGIYVPQKIWIGNNVIIEDFTKISPNVYIEDNVYISCFCALHGDKGIYIKKNTYLGTYVLLYSSSSDYSGIYMATAMVSDKYSGTLGERIFIDKNVRIGNSSCILPGSIIARNVNVLERSLVRGELKKDKKYEGVPVKEIGNTI